MSDALPFHPMNLRPPGLAAVCLAFALTGQGASFTPEQIRHDLDFLYETLQASHYDLFAHVPKEAYDREYQRAHDAIDRPMDDLEAYRILQPFTALAGMAHCNIALPFNAAYVPYVMKEGTVIPFDLTFAGEEAFIWHNYSNESGLAPGTRIIAINGQPVGAVLDGIGRFISGDSPYMQRTNIELTGFPRLYWLAYGEVKKFALTLQQPDGATVQLEMAAVPAMQFEQKQATNKPVTDSSRETRFIGEVAYLRPGAFLNNQSAAGLAAHESFDKGQFIRFIDAAFHDIHEKKPRSLIIDLRGNPGGDNSFSDPMVAYVANRPFRFCSRFDVRTSQVTKDFWTGVKDPSLADLRAALLAHPNGERFQADLPHAEPRPEAERFPGRVYVLVDRFTYSNAVTTAALFQDYKFGVLVGQTTADVPTTYAAAHQFNLPHTQLTVMYPKALMVRPSGDASTQGVRPDHEVSDDVFTADDEILLKALALAGSVPALAPSAPPATR